MITQKQIERQKFSKTRKFFRAAWRATKTALKVSPFFGAPLVAQTLPDTTKAADEAFLTGSLAAKSIVRTYERPEGKMSGIGAGFVANLEIGKFGMVEATFTGVKQTGVKGLKTEEASISAVVPAGPVVVIPYLYSDQYFGVAAATPGIVVKGFGGKLGFELGNDFWVTYGKALLGPLTIGVAGIGWNDNGTRDGPVQKIGIDFNTNATMGNVSVSSEARYAVLLQDGSKSTTFRVTVSVPVFGD